MSDTSRKTTQAWLAAHGIQFGELIMYPASRPEDRHDVGLWKGEIYKQSNTMLFVESCPWQSQQIFSVGRRDVLDLIAELRNSNCQNPFLENAKSLLESKRLLLACWSF